jgi:hypothetical protein
MAAQNVRSRRSWLAPARRATHILKIATHPPCVSATALQAPFSSPTIPRRECWSGSVKAGKSRLCPTFPRPPRQWRNCPLGPGLPRGTLPASCCAARPVRHATAGGAVRRGGRAFQPGTSSLVPAALCRQTFQTSRRGCLGKRRPHEKGQSVRTRRGSPSAREGAVSACIAHEKGQCVHCARPAVAGSLRENRICSNPPLYGCGLCSSTHCSDVLPDSADPDTASSMRAKMEWR